MKILVVILFLSLSGCAIPMGVTMGLSAAGGAAYLAKEVLDIDISYHQLKNVESNRH
jgi:hypothetical protein